MTAAHDQDLALESLRIGRARMRLDQAKAAGLINVQLYVTEAEALLARIARLETEPVVTLAPGIARLCGGDKGLP